MPVLQPQVRVTASSAYLLNMWLPGTLILFEDISGKAGQAEEERQMRKEVILPVMLVSGFVTLAIVSVIISGVFNRFLTV